MSRNHEASAVPVRCSWAGSDPQMQAYHDLEWGVPLRDSRPLWEMLVLEGFQAGLSWITLLHKREAFRDAFAGFDPYKIALFGLSDVERLLGNPAIIRSRAKITATIASAKIWRAMTDAGEDFSGWCWSFTEGKVLRGDGVSMPVTTTLSETISKAMKARGFAFVGPTIVYAWLQSVGMVNDHQKSCDWRNPLPSSRAAHVKQHL